MSPDALQVANSWIMSPWGVKIFYGIAADVVKLPFFSNGSKRGYIILFSLTQMICLSLSGLIVFDDKITIINMFFVCSLCGAFMDTVIDGINCVQQRLDPVHGAQDLQTLAWLSQSVACIFGSIVGGVVVEYSEARYTFLMYAVVAFVVTLSARKMNPRLEHSEYIHQKLKMKHSTTGAVQMEDDNYSPAEGTEVEEKAERQTFCGRIKSDFIIIKDNMKTKVVWRYYLFWILKGFMPSFNSYQYYQYKEVYKLTQVEYGWLTTLETISMLVGVGMYQRFFRDTEMRTLQYYCNFMMIFSLLINLAQVFRLNIACGISDMMTLAVSGTVTNAFIFAMTQLPTLVLFQRLAPDHVEATMMALSASVCNLSEGLMASLCGAFVNKFFVGITAKDYEGATINTVTRYYVLLCIGLLACLYEFLIIPLIPTRSEIEEEIDVRVQQRIDKSVQE